jgi:hypothetical protein
MNGEDWTDYNFQPAPSNLLCQFQRIDERGCLRFVGFAKDMLPEFNIARLQWKLTGIAREQLDRMPPEVRAQVMPQSDFSSFIGQMMMQAECGSNDLKQAQSQGGFLSFFGSLLG